MKVRGKRPFSHDHAVLLLELRALVSHLLERRRALRGGRPGHHRRIRQRRRRRRANMGLLRRGGRPAAHAHRAAPRLPWLPRSTSAQRWLRGRPRHLCVRLRLLRWHARRWVPAWPWVVVPLRWLWARQRLLTQRRCVSAGTRPRLDRRTRSAGDVGTWAAAQRRHLRSGQSRRSIIVGRSRHCWWIAAVGPGPGAVSERVLANVRDDLLAIRPSALAWTPCWPTSVRTLLGLGALAHEGSFSQVVVLLAREC